jgi:hypothetical protein
MRGCIESYHGPLGRTPLRIFAFLVIVRGLGLELLGVRAYAATEALKGAINSPSNMIFT